jgi:uncharacterized protein (TIGR02271 family)
MAIEEKTLPLVAEQARVTSRRRETGRVRIDLTTVEHVAQVPVSLAETVVAVERVPVGRFVETAPETRVEGDMTIIPVVEERAVVTVRLFLREELRVRTSTVRRTETCDVTLRRQQVTIARTGAGGADPEHTDETTKEGNDNDE